MAPPEPPPAPTVSSQLAYLVFSRQSLVLHNPTSCPAEVEQAMRILSGLISNPAPFVYESDGLKFDVTQESLNLLVQQAQIPGRAIIATRALVMVNGVSPKHAKRQPPPAPPVKLPKPDETGETNAATAASGASAASVANAADAANEVVIYKIEVLKALFQLTDHCDPFVQYAALDAILNNAVAASTGTEAASQESLSLTAEHLIQLTSSPDPLIAEPAGAVLNSILATNTAVLPKKPQLNVLSAEPSETNHGPVPASAIRTIGHPEHPAPVTRMKPYTVPPEPIVPSYTDGDDGKNGGEDDDGVFDEAGRGAVGEATEGVAGGRGATRRRPRPVPTPE